VQPNQTGVWDLHSIWTLGNSLFFLAFGNSAVVESHHEWVLLGVMLVRQFVVVTKYLIEQLERKEYLF
jgi:hypothetical protein